MKALKNVLVGLAVFWAITSLATVTVTTDGWGMQNDGLVRCNNGVLENHQTLANANLHWWGPIPTWMTVRNDSVFVWMPTDTRCVA